MSSWFSKVAAKAKATAEPETKTFFTMITEDDPATQYLDLLYCYLYAQSQKGELRVYDHSNPVSPQLGFFTAAFEDLPGLRYIESRDLRSKMLYQKEGTYMPYIRTLSVDTLREAAEKFFRLKPVKLEEVTEAYKRLSVLSFSKGVTTPSIPEEVPAAYDCAMYIQGGPKAVAPYIGSIKALQQKMNAATMNIFVLMENESVLKELAAQCDPSWTFYTVPVHPDPISRSQKVATRVRLENYTQFLAEITMLQLTPNLILPLSTPIGKFVYLTCLEPENVKGVDGSAFIA